VIRLLPFDGRRGVGGDEEVVLELHAEAINATTGRTATTNGRRNSVDLSGWVRVCILTEASFVIDGSRISIGGASPAVRWLSSGSAGNSDVGPLEALAPRWLQRSVKRG
jgi:hypothetical protein